MKKTLIAILMALGLLVLAGCSEIAEPDKIGLYYAEGQSDGYAFDHCINPGAVDDALWNNSVVWLPNNLRTWNIAPSGGDTSTPITVASKPEPNQPSGVQVNVWSQTNLMLNTTCKDKDSVVVKFWERLGRRYNAETEEGWKAMLLNTVIPALEKATRVAVREYSADSLVAGTVIPELQGKVSTSFAEELKRVTGEDYFCGPSFDRATGKCPPVELLVKDIDYTDPGIQEARNNKQKALEQAAAQVAEAEGKVKAANAQSQLYRNAQWMALEQAKIQLEIAKACAASAKCTMVLDSSGNVQVHTS